MAEQHEYAGTLIHGTLRPGDLLESFADFLEREAPQRFEKVLRNYSLEASGVDDWQWFAEVMAPEEVQEILFDLEDALGDIAPEGYYFGTLEGDGSDFGFWPIPEEEEV